MHANFSPLIALPLAAVLAFLASALVRRLTRRIVGADNQALQIVRGADVLGALLIGGATTAATIHGVDWLVSLMWTALFALLAGSAQSLASALGLRALLGGLVTLELSRANLAAGVLAAGYELAFALLAAGCLVGDAAADLGPDLAFFVLGLAAFHLLIVGFRALTPWDDAEQIRDGNVAAALTHAALVVAIGLLVSHATEGDFDGWHASLHAFIQVVSFAILLVPVRVGLVQALLLRRGWQWRGGALDRLVGAERNIGVAVLEGAALMGMALALRAVVP